MNNLSLRVRIASFAIGALLLSALSPSLATADEKDGKTAFVLATFGSTVPQKSDPLQLVTEELKKRHPEVLITTAYTSTHVAKTLRKNGFSARSLNQTLADLAADGFEKVVVQSMHVTPGKEFDYVRSVANVYPALPKGALAVSLGKPLLADHESTQAVADALLASLPKERQAGEPVVFVGHGAENQVGSLAYPALQALLWKKDPAVFVGTIEGPYDLEYTIAAASQEKNRTLWLAPLLTVIGDHARNDIFGDEDDSWKVAFTKSGFTVKNIEKGLLALPSVAKEFADHADDALKALQEKK